MMNMIEGEGTNSDGREVTMIGPEREKTDAEMIGTTGKRKRCVTVQITVIINPMQPPNLQNMLSVAK